MAQWSPWQPGSPNSPHAALATLGAKPGKQRAAARMLRPRCFAPAGLEVSFCAYPFGETPTSFACNRTTSRFPSQPPSSPRPPAPPAPGRVSWDGWALSFRESFFFSAARHPESQKAGFNMPGISLGLNCELRNGLGRNSLVRFAAGASTA